MATKFLSLFFIVFILLFFQYDGRIIEFKETPSHAKFLSLGEPFGAEYGGRVSVHLNVEEKNEEEFPWFYLVIYNSNQYSILSTGTDDPCTFPSVMRYEFTQSITVDNVLEQQDRYHTYLLNCNELEFYYSGSVEWLNLNDNQLSLEEQPLYDYYVLATIPLSILTMIYLLISLYFRKSIERLQVIVISSVTFNTINYFIYCVFFYSYASTGYMDSFLEYSVYLTRVISDSLFLSAMLLVAMGWSIIRRRLPVKSRQLLWGSIILYSGFELSNFLCNSDENICSIYMFQVFYHVIKFLILLGVIVAINSECDKMRRDFDPMTQDRKVVTLKLHLLRNFRFILAVLLISPLFFMFLDFFILYWEEKWISYILNHVTQVAVFWRIAVLLRPSAAKDNLVFLRYSNPSNHHNNVNNINNINNLGVSLSQNNNNHIADEVNVHLNNDNAEHDSNNDDNNYNDEDQSLLHNEHLHSHQLDIDWSEIRNNLKNQNNDKHEKEIEGEATYENGDEDDDVIDDNNM